MYNQPQYGYPPPYGYSGSQPPPPPNYQYNQNQQDMYKKLQDMERRIYGNDAPSYSTNGTQTNLTHESFFIEVNNEDEAWNWQIDINGKKQYFVNKNDGDIYVKWFDANIPDTVKKVYKEIKIENIEKQEEIEEQAKTVDTITPAIEDLTNMVRSMVMDVSKIPKLVTRMKEIDESLENIEGVIKSNSRNTSSTKGVTKTKKNETVVEMEVI